MGHTNRSESDSAAERYRSDSPAQSRLEHQSDDGDIACGVEPRQQPLVVRAHLGAHAKEEDEEERILGQHEAHLQVVISTPNCPPPPLLRHIYVD